MQTELTLLSAFLLGLFGSVHCVGMCGGIVGALTLGLSDTVRQSPWRMLPYLLSYNLGRIASYTVAGAALGWAGGAMIDTLMQGQTRIIGGIVGGLFMVALGLYLAGWWQALTALERAGGALWKHIEPYGRRFMPVRNPHQALLLGALWGWLPCGMVYAALAWSMAAGSGPQGGLLMLAFGLGTLPMLLVLGASARWLRAMVQRPLARHLVGALVIAFGLSTLYMASTHTHGAAATGEAHHHQH